MSVTEDLLGNLKGFILDQNNIQTDKLISYIDNRFSEVEKIIKAQEEKNKNLEKELQHIKARNSVLEKQLRKNNIIIFNLGYTEGDLLTFTLNKLNELLKLPVTLNECDINNIYTVGTARDNKPIILQFVRYLTKQNILHNCKNLKGSKVRISEILNEEEREDRKILVHHLKEAKGNNLKAHIYGNKLYIESKPYTAEDLKANCNDLSDIGRIEKAGEENHRNNEETELEISEEISENNPEEEKAGKKRKIIRYTRSQKQILK